MLPPVAIEAIGVSMQMLIPDSVDGYMLIGRGMKKEVCVVNWQVGGMKRFSLRRALFRTDQ